ncbi:alanine:cation symporter family protein, partial [Priestia megaterium]|uniref:alanine:cation symporter family protein n=1 Tax=Priestia megaterium TaxID=1404 RepID=UPI001F31AA90
MMVLGCICEIEVVWELAEVFMGFMVVVNLMGIVVLWKVGFGGVKDYVGEKKGGKEGVL